MYVHWGTISYEIGERSVELRGVEGHYLIKGKIRGCSHTKQVGRHGGVVGIVDGGYRVYVGGHAVV